jgi:hypothetical protein
MKQEHTIRYDDPNFVNTVTHEVVYGGYHHICIRKVVEGTVIDSKFDMFLTDEQFKSFANFLWFLTSKESS